jgi:hypothetical protein
MKTPSVMVPYANADENNHSPNENLVVDRFFEGIRCTCSVLSGLGIMNNKSSSWVAIPIPGFVYQSGKIRTQAAWECRNEILTDETALPIRNTGYWRLCFLREG